ncbi:hypothetical protein AAZX31_09G119600 [Glycine max]|uniref:HMA domain-containing protein n=1 Tax=Glycine max TaxID=3847 RepID=I1L311_SOYBN|nr:heavy metal-associated isoprenylated plant protein 39 [Glycine max]KAH1233473.1 Heavy metal-associated isoprenylated plant protein 39 [Glycine max]|eukprot:XP_006587269.1 heavy metal-associated isoprenylated plant protein 39 [Glycine max]
MKKVVLKVELHDDRVKQKAMTTASALSGVKSISVDLKDSQMILSGDTDPVSVVSKLRKCCHTEIVSVEPAKEEKETKKVEPAKLSLPLHQAYPLIYYVTSYKENPSDCVIC